MDDPVQQASTAAGLYVAGAIILGVLFLYASGAWMGAKGKIVVFRNFYDVLIVGMLYLVPAAPITFILLSASDNPDEGATNVLAVVLVVTAIIEAVLFLFIFVRTWIDNPNPLKMLLALYVKVPTAVIFFLHFVDAFTGAKPSQRRKSFLWSILMLPLLYALIHDKKTGRLPYMRRMRVG